MHTLRHPAAALAALLLAAPLGAQRPSAVASPAAASLAAAERAFARLSVDSGQHAAFSANLDPRGVVFRPRATNGRAWYDANRPKGPQGTLFWTPAHVGVAASADLGYSLGPFRVEGVRGADTVRAGGFFASVWGRRPGEPWRVLVDLGVRDTVLYAVDSTRTPSVAPAGRARAGVAPTAILSELLAADSALGAHYGDVHAPHGLAARAADDVRLLREPGGERLGRGAARAAAEAAGAGYASRPIAGEVARAGDLAYTYGTYTRDGAAPSAREAGNYLRVWRRDASGWRVVLDVASPVGAGD